MPKITIEFEDVFRDGKPQVRAGFKPDFQDADPNGPPTDAMLAAFVMQEIWSKGTWRGLAQSMAPDVFAHRQKLAAIAAKQAQSDAAVGLEPQAPAA